MYSGVIKASEIDEAAINKYDRVFNDFVMQFHIPKDEKDYGAFLVGMALIEAATIVSKAIDHLTESVYANNI